MPEITEATVERIVNCRLEADKSAGPCQKNEEQIMKDIENTPLFMQSLPQDAESNQVLNALQALVYDGDPEGNDSYKAGKAQYQNAISYYTKGIQVNCSDDKLKSTLYSNRAAANLELENYRKVLNDCAMAIQLNTNNLKAYFRSSRALFALEKYSDAIDCLQKAQLTDPENVVIAQELNRCTIKLQFHQSKLEEKQRIFREKQEKELSLLAVIKSKGIQLKRISSTTKGADVSENSIAPGILHPQAGFHRVHIDKETRSLIWPAMFFYPEFKESDFIAQFDESCTFEDHLVMMFPGKYQSEHAPWDSQREYTVDSIEIYYESVVLTENISNSDSRLSSCPNSIKNNTKLVRVMPYETLSKVTSKKDYVVTDGVPSFILVSKVYSKQFNAQYK